MPYSAKTKARFNEWPAFAEFGDVFVEFGDVFFEFGEEGDHIQRRWAGGR